MNIKRNFGGAPGVTFFELRCVKLTAPNALRVLEASICVNGVASDDECKIGTLPRQVEFSLTSQAISQTHFFYAIDGTDGQPVAVTNLTAIVGPSPPSAPVTVTWVPSAQSERRVLAALNVATFSAYRHYGGRSNGDFKMVVGGSGVIDECIAGSGGYDQQINISGGNADAKFLVAHEVGHCILEYRLDQNVWLTCGYESATCPANQGNANHSPGSKEYQSCSFYEGFARFFATDIFNSHNSQEAVFNYYTNEFGSGDPEIDAYAVVADHSVNGPYPLAFMVNKPCPTPWTNMSTEVDWMRTFWHMHSHPTPVSMNDMTSWMHDTDLWSSPYVTYDRCQASAATIGGNLYTRWQIASSNNGLDP